MNKIIDHRHAHQLCNKYHESDRSLCVIVKDTKEARLLENELSLYIDKIRYFPENEILPYDHFSIPENILKERFQILNTLNENKEIIYANKEIDVKNSLKVRYEFMKQTNLLSSVTADIFRCKSDA